MSDIKPAEQNDTLSESKRALLEQRLKAKQSATTPSTLAIPRRPEDQPRLASPGQTRIWFFQQMNPDSTAYNMVEVYRVEGNLRFDALQASLNAVVKRHESLRMHFEWVDQQLLQIVASELHPPLSVIDLTTVPTTTREATLQQHLDTIAHTQFALTSGPLLRLVILQIAPNIALMVFVVHHIISDERSNRIFWADLAHNYELASGQTPPQPRPELAIQYSDYAYWQQAALKNGGYSPQLRYWENKLRNAPAQVPLPLDHARPAIRTFRGRFTTRLLTADLSGRLRGLAKERSTTLFTTLLAGYFSLIHRYTAETDLVVGIPISNRNQQETEGIIGFFLNTLALRLEVEGDLSFTALLQQVRTDILEAFAHQDIPFDRLVDILQPHRDASTHPFFQTMFVFQDGDRSVQFSNCTVIAQPYDQQVAKFDLTLFAADTGDHIQLSAEYNTDLFDAPTIDRLLGHLHMIFQAVVTHPDTALSQLSLLSADERQQVLFDWNTTAFEYPQQGLIPNLIAANARQTPNAPALIFQGRSISYGEYEQRAHTLALDLQERGIQSGARVGIYMERSLEMFIALYTVLKLGAAYVPLDPSYPQERIATLCKDCEIATVLTHASVIHKLPPTDMPKIIVDASQEIAPSTLEAALTVTIHGDEPAYIIYTSGSTGQPKGVVINHHNLAHSTLARYQVYSERATCFLLLSPLSFDSSVAGIFWTLTQGGALCLPEPGDEKNADRLVELIAAHRVTHTLCLPSLYDILLDTAEPTQLVSFNTIIVAGEACPSYLIEKHFRLLPEAGLYNEYGPTEGTVWATVHRMTRADIGKAVPIGRPIPNMQTYVLDDYQHSVPVGIAGELYIAGTGLAQGYLNRPDLTAERFLNIEATAQRVYRTGDLARYRADGTIDYLGRADHQVKIRGHRIEPAEIEAILLRDNDVRKAVVFSLSKTGGNENELIAFVVLKAQANLASKQLKELVSIHAPDYMVPARIHMLDAIPVTPNGKVDRAALIQHDTHYEPEASPLTSPRTEDERRLAAIWSDLLGVEPIHIEDDFFELGGHSLQAMRLIARINKEFRIKSTVADLIHYPTIESFCDTFLKVDALVPLVKAPSSPHVVAVQAKGNHPIFWGLTRGHLGVFAYVDLSNHLGSEFPVYALRMPGLDGEAEPYEDISALATYFISLIKQHQPQGPYFLGGYSIAGLVAFEIARQLVAAGDQVGNVILFDTVFYDETTTVAFQQIAEASRRKWIRRFKSLPRYVFQYLFMSSEERKKWLDQRRGALPDLSPQTLRKRAVTQALERASKKHTLSPYPGTIFYFRAKDKIPVTTDSTEMLAESVWEKYAEGGMTIVDVPGDHQILGGPHADLVARELSKVLSVPRPLRP